MSARLAVRDLSKHYGGVQALRGICLQVDAGEVLGLVGDNGAGKSTLVKTLSGAIAPSGGEIVLDGEPVRFASPAAAQDAGVSIVYQDLSLADQRDVAANFFLGREILARHWLARRLGWLDTKAMAAQTQRELARLLTRIPNVHAASRNLSGGQRQALAIARAAAWTSKVLLLDEPTSALGVEQQPGMHTTDSVDYALVLDGELWLELDEGQLTKLGPGDTVVQNGTRHGWRDLGAKPVTLVVVPVGAKRKG